MKLTTQPGTLVFGVFDCSRSDILPLLQARPELEPKFDLESGNEGIHGPKEGSRCFLFGCDPDKGRFCDNELSTNLLKTLKEWVTHSPDS